MGRVRTQLISGDKSYQNTPHICISPAPGKPKYTLLAALKMCEIYRSLERHSFWNCIPTTLDHVTTLHISFHCANISFHSLLHRKHKAHSTKQSSTVFLYNLEIYTSDWLARYYIRWKSCFHKSNVHLCKIKYRVEIECGVQWRLWAVGWMLNGRDQDQEL